MTGEAKFRIVHIITGLGLGGAEMMLLKILKAHQQTFDCHVISLTGEGPIAERIRAIGVPVHSLGMSPSLPSPLAIFRLVRWIREIDPRLVQTWMYHADLIGGWAAWLAGNLPLVWGIHNTTLDSKLTRTRTRMVVRINARLSHWLPDRIISCSEKARELHRAAGYDDRKLTVIPNGFDLQDFKPDPEARVWLRSKLGLPAESRIIGHAARFDPQKDYPTLIAAAGLLYRKRTQQGLPEVHFVLCGEGVDENNPLLEGWIEAEGLQGTVHLLGRRDDIARVMAGFDLGTLTSAYGEAFPNVVGEMMACEIPCVVTDIGDAEEMVGETGRVVPPGNPQALVDAWDEMLDMGQDRRLKSGRAARERIQSRFSMDAVARRYADEYLSVLPPASNPGSKRRGNDTP